MNTFSLSDLQGQCQGHSDFESLYVVKELDQAIARLIININRNTCVGSQIGAIIFDYSDLERSVSRSLRFKGLYLTKEELGHVLLIKVKVL